MLSATAHFFPRDLQGGAVGADVKLLQALLVQEVGYPSNLVTGFFGRATKAAVKLLQQKYNIAPNFGYVGPATRNTLKALISSF